MMYLCVSVCECVSVLCNSNTEDAQLEFNLFSEDENCGNHGRIYGTQPSDEDVL